MKPSTRSYKGFQEANVYLIWAGVQFAKIDCQPNHILLQLWRQLKDNQKFQNYPKKKKRG